MKKLIHVSILFVFCFCMTQTLQAQYKTAIGLRLGYPTSVSLKYFATETLAFEAYAGTRGYSFYRLNNVSAALQIHQPLEIIDDLDGLSYYVGGGLSALFWSYEGISSGTTTIGVQGYAGLDYAFEDLPINISLDWIPTYFIGTNGVLRGFSGSYGTLAVRYILGQG